MPLDVSFKHPWKDEYRVVTYPDGNPPSLGGQCYLDGVGWIATEIVDRTDGDEETVAEFVEAKMREEGTR